MSDVSVGYPPGLTREQLISFVRNTVNRDFSQNTIHREKDEIVLFTTRSYSVSQMCRNTATFVKTLFIDPVNSETTVYRERESRTDLV
jgi:hypothetical protein